MAGGGGFGAAAHGAPPRVPALRRPVGECRRLLEALGDLNGAGGPPLLSGAIPAFVATACPFCPAGCVSCVFEASSPAKPARAGGAAACDPAGAAVTAATSSSHSNNFSCVCGACGWGAAFCGRCMEYGHRGFNLVAAADTAAAARTSAVL